MGGGLPPLPQKLSPGRSARTEEARKETGPRTASRQDQGQVSKNRTKWHLPAVRVRGKKVETFRSSPADGKILKHNSLQKTACWENLKFCSKSPLTQEICCIWKKKENSHNLWGDRSAGTEGRGQVSQRRQFWGVGRYPPLAVQNPNDISPAARERKIKQGRKSSTSLQKQHVWQNVCFKKFMVVSK